MTITKLGDMIIPSNFAAYTAEQAVAKNKFFKGGIIASNPQLASLLEVGGKTINMPFVKPLTGDSEVPSETNDMGIGNISTSEDIARRQLRVKAWGENQLASLLSGDNVMDRISDAVSDYWSAELSKILISTCTGVFAKLTNKVNDITVKTGNAALLNPNDAIDTKYIIGDSADAITAIAIHSAVYAYMLKMDQITNVPTSDGKGVIQKYGPLNATVLVDDSVPYDSTTKVGAMYLYGPGAFGFVESNNGIEAAEITRNPLKGLGENILISRKQFVLHPLGVQWNEPTSSITSPANSDLETATRWTKVKEDKNIYLAQFKFKIA
ncbi:hypothetical protein FDC45_15530 [Clostridium botulinum]|uniref:Phage coat protein n=2 Tax=Clostridium TaxID=1485 RepID=A0A846JEW5_CLOBO|nr:MULTISPECIES: major capsid protein [Clostridium]ACA54538.1 phage coat protein [Clostridium botulinum A3 str. Loch Maree]APQ73802.1 putative phage coat protein [Clostridium botulinum]MDS1004180.1 major capsid protein [Clostridium sporogenes]NFH66139.1 hypothetical protein [Clostridium botulinum]NFJ08714.1 hypothetical protein [Clostridium botulinum]